MTKIAYSEWKGNRNLTHYDTAPNSAIKQPNLYDCNTC